MTTLTTHVLDVARGLPAAGIGLRLYTIASDRRLLAEMTTNDDGRTDEPLGRELNAGSYEIVFAARAYFERTKQPSFYDDIPIRFRLETAERYHVPLLLAPWGYSTYRGS